MAGINVAVITPYYKETDDVLRDCLTSVRDQDYKSCRHFLVADGFPNPIIAEWDVEHIILPRAHDDYGNLARCVGALSAISEGFDAIAFLDADNWYRADHIAKLVTLFEKTGAPVCTASRTLHRLDKSLLGHDDAPATGRYHADTSCLCFFGPAFHVLPLWGLMPGRFGLIGDAIIWAAIKFHKLARAHSPEPTVAFRTKYAWDYTTRGETPPPGAKAADAGVPLTNEYNNLRRAEKELFLSGVRTTFSQSKKVRSS